MRREGVTTTSAREIRKLNRKNAELGRTIEILRDPLSFFAPASDLQRRRCASALPREGGRAGSPFKYPHRRGRRTVPPETAMSTRSPIMIGKRRRAHGTGGSLMSCIDDNEARSIAATDRCDHILERALSKMSSGRKTLVGHLILPGCLQVSDPRSRQT